MQKTLDEISSNKSRNTYFKVFYLRHNRTYASGLRYRINANQQPSSQTVFKPFQTLKNALPIFTRKMNSERIKLLEHIAIK